MQSFPAVDPIPLPAPIWLFKLLHIVTLALHFVAVEMLLGGLLIAVLLSLFRGSPESTVTARAMARRLTVVMTYVINLGVPPLLFAQVLYGRALYTSSVLIGVYWISIIPILMLTYWLLYRFSARLEAGKSAWWVGLQRMAAGRLHRPPALHQHDPDAPPRSLARDVLGFRRGRLSAHRRPHPHAALAAHAGRRPLHRRPVDGLSRRPQSTFTADEKQFLAGLGGKVAAALRRRLSCSPACGPRACSPTAVKAGLASASALSFRRSSPATAGWRWSSSPFCWLQFAGFGKIAAGWHRLGWRSALPAHRDHFTVYRDGIRDLTLLSKGYDVWDRVVVTNWSVVGMFLVLFVAGLVVVGWLVSVVARAKK